MSDRGGTTIVHLTSGVVGYVHRFLPIGRALQRRGHRVVVVSASERAVDSARADGLGAVHLARQAAAFAALPPPASWPAPLGSLTRYLPGVALGPRGAARRYWAARADALADVAELLEVLHELDPALVLTEAEEHRDIRAVLGARRPLALFEDLYATRPDPGVPFPARSHHVPTGTAMDRVRAAARWQRFFAVEAVRRRAEAWWVDGRDWHSTLATLCDPAVLDEAGTNRRYLQFYDYGALPHIRTVAPELAVPGERHRPTVTGPVVDTERGTHGVDEGFDAAWAALQHRLDDGERLLYLTLGTFLSGLDDLTATVLDAAASLEGVQVLAALGEDAPRWRDRALPANVAVFGRVPQLRVIERSAVVVSTGGLNTGHEALWFGVPVLNIPIAGVDTPGNAARLVHHGVGRRLRRREVSVDAVRRELRTLLDDPGYRERAAQLSHSLRAWNGIERAAGAIEALARAEPAGWAG